MTKIYNTISDMDSFYLTLEWYENGSINQWQLYTNNWWVGYYKMKNKFYSDSDIITFDDYLNFGEKKCFSKNKKTLLISLWCGNSEVEKRLLWKFTKENDYNITYLWIDSSDKMLKMSVENLKELNVDYSFIRADFTSQNLVQELKEIENDYDETIYAFFWQTFWNIKHTKIINILYNLLDKWEKIWLDAALRKENSLNDDLDLHTIYSEYINDTWFNRLLTDKLLDDGINKSNGDLLLETTKINDINALMFTFSFIFKKLSTIKIRNTKLTFLPDSKIELLKIHRFNPNNFIDFFNDFWFSLQDKQIKWYRGQFLFEKK